MGAMLLAGFLLLFGLLARKGFQASEQPSTIPTGLQAPQSGATLKGRADGAGGRTTAALRSADQSAPLKPRHLQAVIPRGAHFISASLDGDKYIMTLETPKKGLTVLFFDLRTWRLAAQADLKQVE